MHTVRLFGVDDSDTFVADSDLTPNRQVNGVEIVACFDCCAVHLLSTFYSSRKHE